MTATARIMAVAVALAGIVLGAAGLVRAVALAADDRLVWRLPEWWRDLGAGSTSWIVALIGGAVAALAVACLVVAFRQLAPGQEPTTVSVGDTRIKVAALQRLLATRLRAEIPGLVPLRIQLLWTGEGWDVSVLADAPARDLSGVRALASRVAAAELGRATGGALTGLDLEVRRFVGAQS